MFGSFSGSGLGFGVAFTLVDKFSQTSTRIQQSLQKLGLDVKKFQSEVSGGFTKMATGAVVAGAGLATLAPILGSIKEAANFEQTKITFDTLFSGIGKSKEDAQAFLKEMENFAATTPFGLKNVEDNARNFMGINIGTEKILPTLRTLGDVAAGLSLPLERVAYNYGQIFSQGKMSGQDMKDFQRMGVPILQGISNVTGLAISEVKKLDEISFELVEKAFNEGMPQFKNLMEEQSKSLLGVIANIEDSIDITKRRIGGLFMPLMKMVAEGFSKFMEKVKNFVETPLGKTIIYIVASIGALITVAGLVVIAFGAFQIVTALLSAAFTILTGIVSTLLVELLPFIAIGLAVGLVIYSIYKYGKQLEQLGVKNNFFVMLVNMGSVLKALYQAWTSFSTATETFELEGALADKLQKLGILDFTMGLISWLIRIKTFFLGVWEAMVNGFRFLKEVVMNVWDYIKPTIMNFFESFGIHLDRNMSKLSTWATAGKVVGYIIIGVLAAIGIAFVIFAAVTLIVLSPVLIMIWLIYKAIQAVSNSFVGKGLGKLWSWVTGSKNADGISDSPLGGGMEKQSNTPLGLFSNRQDTLMMTNAKNKATQQSNVPIYLQAPQQDNSNPIINNFIVDGEPLFTKFVDRQEIEKSRK